MNAKPPAQTAPPDIESLILELRGHKVILDADLALIYGVPTKRLNEQVKRNAGRFPSDFLFRLTVQEAEGCRRSTSQIATLERGANAAGSSGPALKSQIATSSFTHGGRRKLPYAFTEHGAIMAANVLNSPQAIQMSVFVVRAFVSMRSALGGNREMARKFALLEQELKIRLNIHESAIVDVLQRIMRILDPPPPPPEPPPPEIGFHVKEDAIPYRIRKRRKARAQRNSTNGVAKGPWRLGFRL
jgi:hypothetical protein